MDRAKEAAAEAADAAPILPGGALSPKRAARLPGAARFVLAVVLSFALSALGRSFVDHWSNNEMGSIAREITSQTELSVLAGWKLFGLALGWYAGYDGFDLAALALLSHGPVTFVTTVFYGIRGLTASAYLAVEIASASLPFLLLRRLSAAHSAAPRTPGLEVVLDRTILALTWSQSAGLYISVLLVASHFILPTNFVLYFQGIPTVQPAADASLFGPGNVAGVPLSMLCGLAARSFIFVPLVSTEPVAAADVWIAAFDPVHATLLSTLQWNLFGYTTRARLSVSRISVAVLFTAVGTYLDTAVAINGVEPYGGVVYAAVWVVATVITGGMLHAIACT
ncbi:uncharacterized protein B0H64DRAFT_162838 [Chaetomium fimeti]|uniref:Uncharacterized protein n=1 Tax=Chaetomium fimeti TaxID=1854472 RepID=A0AAE0HH09_9PEZI|nr:hypothetical protein B0H64DRAFT_162838 [Chaetomium fimeti]